MKILCIHAHFDDFEFTAGGIFGLLRQKLKTDLRAKLLVCTDGEAGHHFRTRAETGRLRLKEQRAAAKIGGYEFELLRLPNGKVPREASLRVTTDLLAALWKAIRDFEPDYIFCPPVVSDPLAGIHVDHVAVATAVREVAYMINVPHAFTPEYPADETRPAAINVPVILNVYDPYQAGTNSHDFAVNVEKVFPQLCEMTWCHQSQVVEWLPWVNRRNPPPNSLAEWRSHLGARFQRQNLDLGISSPHAHESFTVTAWGRVPTYDELLRDFPFIVKNASNLERLAERLARWNRIRKAGSAMAAVGTVRKTGKDKLQKQKRKPSGKNHKNL